MRDTLMRLRGRALRRNFAPSLPRLRRAGPWCRVTMRTRPSGVPDSLPANQCLACEGNGTWSAGRRCGFLLLGVRKPLADHDRGHVVNVGDDAWMHG